MRRAAEIAAPAHRSIWHLCLFTLGRSVPAKEVEDDRAVVQSRRASRPDRDELYSK
jgi:hypothetical protein